MLRIAAYLLIAALSSGAAFAQEQPQPQSVPLATVAIIDADQVFTNSLYGRRVLDDIQQQTDALEAENARIADALTEEEKSLAERRELMSPENFRDAADAFDERVQGIRVARDAKEEALKQQLANARAAFDDAVRPILGELMQERRATVLMARRDVILYFGSADITAPAIALIDERLGDGSDLTEPAAE
ncbi:OmpH family outer membrane protein [Marivivens aquimaris]|uniref:OmpH family outer membrane protein n=1 Tax=Marivivens aquimaris TaxID=2774876 RepID=UPI0018825693|nr:OmpH family outer membrane protein [Marivivens aquimaris]